MEVENKDLIITDPCYIALDKDWGEVFDYDDYYVEDPHFSQYEWEETGYGDGSPRVLQVPQHMTPKEFLEELIDSDEEREEIGECGVDSGTFGVFILEEALKYNPEFLDKLPKTCYCIIKNFTGIVYKEFDSNEYVHFILKPDNLQEYSLITD